MAVIDLSQPSLWISLLSIAFNPTFWNIAAQQEYRTHWITRLFDGDKYRGCYALAATIFVLGLVRDALFKTALLSQPSWDALDAAPVHLVAAVLVGAGLTFVVSSTFMLGITGTFLGDYFGILMKQRVTGFPFNVLENPMYVGSTMSFLGTSLWYAKPAGVLVTAYVWFVYSVALQFEGPFTTMIYSKHATSSTSSSSSPASSQKSSQQRKKKL
ncbi:Phosphatidyl-N-methylethanolamine N-methyltransferase [Coemansia sp. RSA 2049]|nr:Phosphatidyl-N-methylethanolamine N-methyltransferase [Coemansia sp. RSA 2049]KAJ2522217.1 Phosphatidyl-N-methylethanolamine N-methyltransferase [Coemansia sp. RSA 1939]KAJ2617817.1 Phosphatidyl-N-methylethanolamine N-methyltransferase [Coemansia sp. RSA 1804]KAJ2695203.1 Phosphatidyl-N-methylethanolamine N-methyltransferase [Coemansia sp. RSA 1285]